MMNQQLMSNQTAPPLPLPLPQMVTATAGGDQNQPMTQTEYPVKIAANSFIQGAAGGENSAMKRADKAPGAGVTEGARNGDMVTQQTPSNGRFYLPGGFARTCDQCGREYTAKRDTSRFCGSACRTAAHRQRHGDGEAGGGRAVVFLALAAIALAWFLWPSLQAARAALAGQTAFTVNQVGHTAVSPMSNNVATAVPIAPITDQGQGETAVSLSDLVATAEAMVAGQTAVTIAPITDQGQPETAVSPVVIPTQTAVTIAPITDQGQPETAVSPVVIPTQTAVTIAPITPDQGQGETAVSLETVEFWRVCAAGQAAGRRVSPQCPPDAAAALAGLQGQGR